MSTLLAEDLELATDVMIDTALAALTPSGKEHKALSLFVSQDQTRPHLATLWRYASDGGLTYVATDGHTILVRRAGAHRSMSILAVHDLGPDKATHDGSVKPPAWAQVLRAPNNQRGLAKCYGISPYYFARIGEVETAVAKREADDYQPKPGTTLKNAKRERENAKVGALSTLVIGSDPLDGWYWKIVAKSALWEGVIMPRRT